MAIVLYLFSAFFVFSTIAALSGRTTYPINGIEPGYFAWNKINKDDPNRTLYMVTQSITNLLTCLGFLGLGLYLDGIFTFSKTTIAFAIAGYFLIIVALVILYNTKIKRKKS